MKEIYLKLDLNILFRYQTHGGYVFRDIYVFKYTWIENHLVDEFCWMYESDLDIKLNI